MFDKDLVTVIDLNQSTYAHGFNKGDMIHQYEFDRVIELIDKQMKAPFAKGKNDAGASYHYNTISIFGERGTGKTSFLYSIVNHVRDYYKDIAILDMIDPTMIEEKEHIFLLVVSLINKAVEDKLKSCECSHDTQSYSQRQIWKTKLQRLAKGLPTLDKIGEGHQTQQWQSYEFIMENGLENTLSAFNLAHVFHDLVVEALNILERKVFLLTLDDIDVDMKKGWDVLEMLRKYVNTPQIITLLCGNFKLYSQNVRKQQWKQLEENIKFEKSDSFRQMVNELEGQYLLKILKPQNRIHLQTVSELIDIFKYDFKIVGLDKESISIKEAYKKILWSYGIKGAIQSELFTNYLLSLSIRTQIQFLASNKVGIEGHGVDSVEAFLTRLYAADVDVASVVNNAQLLPLAIQKYLERLTFTPDLYLLTPNTTNEDINACMTAFSLLLSKETRTYPFLILDFMIRFGYMRNLRIELESGLADRFYDSIGLTQLMSLKNNVGLTMAYTYNDSTRPKSHVVLPGFANKMKKMHHEQEGHIDYEVKSHANNTQAIIAYLPLCVLRYMEKKETRVLYSFYNLLAVIAEILKIPESESQFETIKATLKNLQAIRSYPTRSRDGEFNSSYEESSEADVNINREDGVEGVSDDNTLDELTELMMKWAKEFHENIPPYLIGKIATRTYYAIQKIDKDNLGEQMHRSIIAFLNASLIEEMFENYRKTEGKDSIDKLNNSNAINEDDIFFNNLKFAYRNEALNAIKFTLWMAKCPLLWSFMHEDALLGAVVVEKDKKKVDFFDFGYSKDLKVNAILSEVVIKDSKKESLPTFSGAADRIMDTIKYLQSVPYDVEKIMNPHRAIPVIIDEIDKLGIFSKKPQKNQISHFRTNYKSMPKEISSEPIDKKALDTEAKADEVDMNEEWRVATAPNTDAE